MGEVWEVWGRGKEKGKGGKGREGRGASGSVSASTVVAVLTSRGEVTARGQILTSCQKLGLSGNKGGRLCREAELWEAALCP